MENKITTQPLKGFRDFIETDALKREWLKNLIVGVFKKWGYSPMETPALESLSLFEGQIGDDEKLFYKFKDNGGRDVALRYDQTVPTCRVIANNYNNLVFPYKRYLVQSAFRAENTQKGRYREFVQCDADIFGVDNILADAEVIALSLDIYTTIGFKNVKVLINDRSLLKDIPYTALSSIDKREKIGEAGVILDMINKGISKADALIYLEKVKNIKPNDNILKIFNYLEMYGFSKSMYKFTPMLIRSFSYSSGPIWEIVEDGLMGSMLGGERYDNLIEKISGKKIPATGFGLGFDRTLEAAEMSNLIPKDRIKLENISKVLVNVLDEKYQKEGIELTSKFRSENISCEYYPFNNNDLSKTIKYVLKKNIPYMVIIGENEAKENKYLLKDLEKNSQTLLTLKELIDFLSR